MAALVAAVGLATGATGADYKSLRAINGGPPTAVPPLPAGARPRAVQFVRAVIHPPDGEAWALEYGSIAVSSPDNPPPPDRLVSWNNGAAEEKIAPFDRVFGEEMRKAGFATQAADSLFDDNTGSADLKVAVLVTDMKGRFCRDCPNMFNRKAAPASVIMTAQWEVYSTLERKVVAKITTHGGGDSTERLAGSYLPGVLEGFRENVRQLLASDEFRRLVTTSTAGQISAAPSSGPGLAPIALARASMGVSLSQAAKSVAIIYAADGQGSGFLVSSDGYVLTNQHVVGGSKYVKLKWPNGAETLGEVIRADRRRDVALIKTDAQGRTPLALRPGAVQQGETVYAIGTPLDDSLQNTMTKGIVSAERVDQGLRYIQSDAGVNHGNSGGPLIDEKGEVVALTVAGLAPNGTPVGLNFFIPIDDALKSLALTQSAAAERAPPKVRPPVVRKR